MSMSDISGDAAGAYDNRIRRALQAVTSSTTFEATNRLSAFLTYVVEEQLAGRGDLIRAKRIAADVYGRPPEEGSEQETLVRVDAGRLRRRLDQYYATEGSDDSVRIVVKSGGYAPTFEERATDKEAPIEPPSNLLNRPKRVAAVAALSLVLVVAVGFIMLRQSDPAGKAESADPVVRAMPADMADDRTAAQRSALFDKSPSALMAQEQIDQARDLVFPPINPARVKSAAALCESAIKLDSTNPGGYACAARAHAFLAFGREPGPEADALIATARKFANRAVDIAPTNSYAQSALGWVKFVGGERESGMELARRAVALDPQDELSRNFYGSMAVFNGDSEEILAMAQSANVPPEEMFYPFSVARAFFHTGQYDAAIRIVREMADKTGRTSNLMAAILAASYQAIGEEAQAQKFVNELRRNRPEYEKNLRRMYSHKEDAYEIINLFQAAESGS